MRMPSSRGLLWVAALGAGLLAAEMAGAWYGSPWYRPFGAGAMTYERQNIMRGHGSDMADLAGMLEGRRAFNRQQAVDRARELEAGFGEELLSKYAPGAVVAGSRTAPWTWRNFDAFRGYTEAARTSAGRLAEALAEVPTQQDMQSKGAWVTGRSLGRVPWRYVREGLVSMDAVDEFTRLNATCRSCHAAFRGPRW